MSRNKRHRTSTATTQPSTIAAVAPVQRHTPPALPAGASYRPIQPIQPQQQSVVPQKFAQALVTSGRYPGQNLAGDNSTPLEAYSDKSGMPQNSVFPPGDPIRPTPGLGPRQYAYPVGVNIAPTPRNTEATSFETLRSLSQTYEGIALCKRAFFRIMQRLDLSFVPQPEYLGDEAATSDKWLTPGLRMRDWFLDGPSKRGNDDLASWLKAVINDLLEIDAVGIWPEPTRAGKLYALRYVAGDSLQVLQDVSGSVPRPPMPAYRQVVYGAPGPMFCVAGPRVNGTQLDYLKMVTRTDSLYGKSPVEDMILRVNQALRKESYDLRRYTDGATPEGVIETERPELFNLTPDQVQTYEQFWNGVLAGNDALRVRTKFVQPGFHFTSTKQAEIAIQFDEFLLGICVAMFGLTKDEVSFTDTSNRAVGSSQENVTYRNAVKPTADFFAKYFTRLARRYDGQPLSVVDATVSYPGQPTTSKAGVWDGRYLAKWGGIEEADDWNKKVSSYIALKNAGMISPTKALRQLGIPLEPGEKDVPAYQVAQGGMQSVIIVPDIAQHRDAMQEANAAALDAKTASSKQVTEAMEHGGAMTGGMAGPGGAGGMNPIAAQAAAAGKPQAAQQAANGGQQQQPQASATVPQKAAAQQVGAKVASANAAAKATRGEEEPEQYAARISTIGSGDAHRTAVAGLAPATGEWDSGRGEGNAGYDAMGAAVVGAGRAALADPAGAGNRSDGAGPARGGATTPAGGGGSRGAPDARLQSVASEAGARGIRGAASSGTAYRAIPVTGGDRAVGNADGATRGARGARAGDAPDWSADGADRTIRASGSGGATVASEAPDDTRGTSSGDGGQSDRENGEEASAEERSEDWRRWRERALKAVRRGERIAPFVSATIPADLHAWVAARLTTARTPDDVRAIFAAAREREQRDTASASSTAADTGANHTGVMVAFLVPPEIAQQLAVPGGVSPDDHHITLAYLGDKDDYTPQQQAQLKRSVASFATDEELLPDAKIAGVGRFPANAESGQYPVIARVEPSPALLHFRKRLMKHLEADGFAPSRQFTYTPHITLDYVDDGAPPTATDADVPKVAIPLHRVTLAIGDEHHHTVVGNEQFGNQLDAEAKAEAEQQQRMAADPIERFINALTARMEAQTAQIAAESTRQMRELRTTVLETLTR